MKTLNIITLILVILIVLIAIIIIMLKYFNEKIDNINYKLSNSENEYYEKIKNKYNIIIKLMKLIQDKYKVESKIFEDVKKLDENELQSLKSDKLLNKCYTELIEIKEDHQKKRELKCFRETIDEYEDNETHIISLRTYYNKYVLEYNNLIKKFPYNIISKTKKLKLKTILEGKELDINLNNDLEV